MIAMFVVLSAWIGAIIDQSAERGRLIRELEATRQELAAVERQAGVLEERQRLAREIHDTLAQGFTSIVMHLEAAEARSDGPDDGWRHHLEAARRTARESLTESRRFLAALRPGPLESSPLPETLQRVVAEWSRETGTRATFTVVGTPRTAAPEADVTLLRATQEALTNARRHASASHVAVTLSYLDDQVLLDVRDDGAGFDANGSATSSPGLGLVGMRERAARLGGSVAVESRPGVGTAVAVALPSDVPASDRETSVTP